MKQASLYTAVPQLTFLSHCRLFATGNRSAMEPMKRSHKPRQPSYAAHYSHVTSHNWAATALWKRHFCPCPFAQQFLISEPFTRRKASIRKGNGKSPWITARNWKDRCKLKGSVFIAQDSLQPQTLEKIIFSLPITKLLCICKRGEEPAHWSLIPMQRGIPCANTIHGQKKIKVPLQSGQED